MPGTKKKTTITKLSKKDIKHDIIKKIETALADLKTLMGEKKFGSKVKKAAKLFLHATPKKPKVKKAAPAKKKPTPAAKKKVAAKPKTARKK
jgi:hypothetical protein